jgi:uncharacterized membrane protein YtjA (UPF0391 family)
MLKWTIVLLVVALIAGVLGFAGIAGAATEISKIVFFVFLALPLEVLLFKLAELLLLSHSKFEGFAVGFALLFEIILFLTVTFLFESFLFFLTKMFLILKTLSFGLCLTFSTLGSSTTHSLM